MIVSNIFEVESSVDRDSSRINEYGWRLFQVSRPSEFGFCYGDPSRGYLSVLPIWEAHASATLVEWRHFNSAAAHPVLRLPVRGLLVRSIDRKGPVNNIRIIRYKHRLAAPTTPIWFVVFGTYLAKVMDVGVDFKSVYTFFVVLRQSSSSLPGTVHHFCD